MCAISWKCVLCTLFFGCAVTSLDTGADTTLEGSSLSYPGLAYRDETPNPTVGINSPPSVQLSEPPESYEMTVRQKRNILFSSGVKLCDHETVQQVISTHLSYFHLRVCQETVWEAFKIFWDRLPEQKDYQSWMSQCQEGAVSAKDIGIYFSQSEEHEALVKRRMAQKDLKSEPTRSWHHMCSTPETPETPEGPEGPEEAGSTKEEAGADGLHAAGGVPAEVEEGEAAVVTDANPLDNDIGVEPPAPPVPPVLEQAVELSVLLSGEIFSEELRDPTSLQHQILTRHFIEKIEEALEAMPGFKSVSVLDLRPQRDAQGHDGVLVDYAVTVQGEGVSTEQRDYLTLQSNRVETTYREVEENPTVVYTVSGVRIYATEALEQEERVSESTEAVHPVHEDTVKLVVDETSGIPILEGDTEDILSQPPELKAAPENKNYDILLEESATEAFVSVPATAATVDGMKEEGLMVEDSVLSPAPESPLPEDLPVQPTSPVQAEAVTLEELLLPSTTTEEEFTVEETGSEADLIVKEEVSIKKPTKIQDTNEEEVATVMEELVVIVEDTGEEKKVNDVLFDASGSPLEIEISTVTTEIIEEEEDDHVPGLEVIEETPHQEEPGETSKPELEPADIGLLPVSDVTVEAPVEDLGIQENPPTVEDSSPGLPEDSAPVDPEAQETLEAPRTTEDEVLLANEEAPEPPVTLSLSPAQPTGLSSERDSPFTRVSNTGLSTEEQPEVDISITVELHTTQVGLVDVTDGDLSYDINHYGYGVTNHTEEGSSGFPSGVAHATDQASIAMPITPRQALMVFFSLRVTNMIFSDDLFNKSSAEYKALEQRFLELLVPYLQSNLSNFLDLEILNFRNGSIVVNSRMKFGKPVPRGVTTAVYLILEDFCNTAYQTMNLAIDKYSLDVESGDQADPCKFQACNEYAACKVNRWSGEAECVCNAGYFSVDGLPCQSICELQTDFCQNDGKCDIIPGQGAICRCRVGENWWYRGEHCEEYVSEPLVVGIAIASVAGFLLVASGVIFFLARTLRDQYEKEDSEDPIRQAESLPSLERATKYNPMYESEATTGYSHYYRRYPEAPVYSSASAEASTDFSSEEIRHIYENSELTKEEIQDRIRIIELYAKDRQFADFVRQHQTAFDAHTESSSGQT